MKTPLFHCFSAFALLGVVGLMVAARHGHAVAVAAPAAAVAPLKMLHWQPLMEPGSGGAMVDVSVCPWDSKRLLVAGDMLGVGLSLDQGDSWKSTFGFKTWEMASFTWHPTDKNEVWIGSMSGPYKSSDGGANWTQMKAGMPTSPDNFGHAAPIEKVLFDPNDSTHLLAVGGSSRHWDAQRKDAALGVVWESRDGGESWSHLSTVTADGSSLASDARGVNITAAYFAPGGTQPLGGTRPSGSSTLLYACADEAGFLVSQNGGKTWEKRNNGLPLTDHRIALHPTNAQVLWASVDNTLPEGATQRVPGGVYKTVDGGLHWTNSSKGLAQIVTGQDSNLTSHYRALAVAPSNPNVLYTNDFAWTTGTTYKSEDGGASWRAVVSKRNLGIANEDPQKRAVFQIQTATPAGMGLAGLTIDPRNANTSYGFNTEFITRSRDGGKSWDDATAQKVGGGWRGRGYSGWVTSNFKFNPFKRGQSAFQGMDAARVWVSSDDLQSWNYIQGAPDAWSGGRDTTFTRAGAIYSTFGTFNFTGIGRSTDNGQTWTVLSGATHDLPDFYKGQAPGGIYALPDDSKVWAVIDGKLLQSVDRGQHWTRVLERPGLQWIAADPKKPARFFVSGERNIYLTNDGAKFSAIGGPRTRDSQMTVDSRGRLLVAASGNSLPGLWRCDLGASAATPTPTWTRLCDEGNIGAVAVDPGNPNRIAFSTNQNPFTDVSAATGAW